MAESNALLTRDPIDVRALVEAMRDRAAGAVATFEGVVRAEKSREGRELVALDYSAYEEMAAEQMAALLKQCLRDHAILRASVRHRLGRMAVGETSVAIAVVAAHRGAAFDACRWLIDAVKRDVPIWKRDVWSDGTTEWVDPLQDAENG